MELEEKILSTKRKQNMQLYSIHRMLTADLLFYYSIKFLFLTQIKSMSASDIVLASAFWGIFKVIFQIPVTAIVDKMGNKKSLIIADIFQVVSVILVMLSNNLPTLIVANLFGAVASAQKEVSESGMLNLSISDSENRSQIYSKVDGKGLGNYYYLSAITAILSGFLFDINPYIPMVLCVVIILLAAFIASKFNQIESSAETKTEGIINKNKIEIIKRYKVYFKNLKLAFSFIFNSRRLKALMLFSGIMYGIIMVLNTYEMGLLDEIQLSATSVGIIYAAMQIVAGISSKMQNKFHEKFKNKTLKIIGISYTIACLVAGLVSITNLPHIIIVTIVVITYVVRYLGMGFHYVLIKKYLTNFTNVEVANKVYSAQGLVNGLGNTLVCAFGSLIVSVNSIKVSMIILGFTFLIALLAVLKYMKTRVGLAPKDYRKKDINYKEYVNLK